MKHKQANNRAFKTSSAVVGYRRTTFRIRLRREILTVAYRVSKAQFNELVEAALEELPEEFAKFIEEVPVEVQDQPDASQLRQARVSGGGLLLGLYVGRPRTMRSVEDSGALPDVIYIFQQPIETVCNSEEQLIRQVRVTVLHEIGHHFGLNEDDLTRLGYR
jgi:predicted Zn-dependent protease with MMP-like domain